MEDRIICGFTRKYYYQQYWRRPCGIKKQAAFMLWQKPKLKAACFSQDDNPLFHYAPKFCIKKLAFLIILRLQKTFSLSS
ncbi:MAG: hypothetical protein RR349_07785, partial [Oscillospiraceae bacterium]